MNTQNFGEHYNSSDFVERTNPDANTPAVNLDPYADKITVDSAFISETRVSGTVAAVGLMDDPLVQDAPMAGTLYRAPVEETFGHEAPIPYKAPVVETIVSPPPASTTIGAPVALLNHEESEHLRTRWNEIQGKFVDEPRAAVQQADELVSEVIEKITQVFKNEHGSLEGQWKQGNDVSTEDLRQALQRYRSFFNRLVV